MTLTASTTISQNKTTIYLFPGQGSDHRIFQELTFDSTTSIVNIEYPIPEKGMKMDEYAKVIAEKIDTTQPYVFIGMSLGGMICVELCDSLSPIKTILISSAKNRNELPLRYRFQKTMPIYKLFPARMLLFGAKMLQPIVEPDRNTHKATFKSMLARKKPLYMKRTIAMITGWERKSSQGIFTHIHGDNDHTIPVRNVDYDHLVKGGSHMMTLTMHERINALINYELKSIDESIFSP